MSGPPKHVAAVLDLHVHSGYSPDARGTIKDLAAVARRKGVQGFVMSDHNTYRGAADIRRVRLRDLLVIPGTEVTTTAGHCLALGIRKPVASHRPLVETLEAIEHAGGVGVPSHPFRIFNGVGGRELRAAGRRLVAVEVFNARDGRGTWHNPRAQRVARDRRLGGTGGSDAHQVFELGNGYTMFPDFPQTVDDVVDQIASGRTWGGGEGTPKNQLVLQKFKNLRLWVQRGFKPM